MNIIVDLNNIKSNINKMKEITNRNIIAVVKSNAYGLGSRRIISFLIEQNINYFFFNKLSEYQKEYEIIKNVNSIIFESLKLKQIEKINNPNIIISINSIQDMKEISKINTKIRVHLQIDTGMNRLGIRSLDDCKEIIDIARTNPNIMIEGIYTHYGSSVDEYFNIQQDEFKKYLELYNFKIIHSNSTSTLHKNIIGNFIRVGMGLYGYHSKIGLKKTISAYTKVLNIFNLKEKEKLGYGEEYFSKGLEKIAVIDIGYYDSKIIDKVYYLDKSFKIIARKCMNHSYIKINDEINLQSHLSVIVKSDIIFNDEYNYYHVLVSLDHLKKNYQLRCENEIFDIFKRTNKKSRISWFRKRSYSSFNFRNIRIK